jgi:auxin efflux carrier family protein
MRHFDWLTSPTSYQNAHGPGGYTFTSSHGLFAQKTVSAFRDKPGHPDLGHLTLLVFEAVLQVVCVSLPGYIVARQGMFDAESQKFLANLNVMLFTPCLSMSTAPDSLQRPLISAAVFSKLASQLTADQLVNLAIIPVIFIVQTLVSYTCAVVVAKCFRFKKRQKNFVIAMGVSHYQRASRNLNPLTGTQVFGNSNSLPISLVISLSQTLRGLHWDKVPNDNDDEVGARGILYLLIFQQLGQLLRWSWGYNVLLAPAEKYSEEDGGTDVSRRLERGQGRYRDNPEDDSDRTLLDNAYDDDYESEFGDDEETRVGGDSSCSASMGAKTPTKWHNRASTQSSGSTSPNRQRELDTGPELLPTPTNGNVLPNQNSHIISFPSVDPNKDVEDPKAFKGIVQKLRRSFRAALSRMEAVFKSVGKAVFQSLPGPLQSFLVRLYRGISRFVHGLWEFMNPPLWAMLVAVMVASVPSIQHVFFAEGTFIQNSVTRAIGQSAGVAVPLILVVLGGNLAR